MDLKLGREVLFECTVAGIRTTLNYRDLSMLYHSMLLKSAKHIARDLGVDYRCIDAYRSKIKKKLNCKLLSEVVEFLYSKEFTFQKLEESVNKTKLLHDELKQIDEQRRAAFLKSKKEG